MNFDLSPDQKLLAETTASFVKKEAPLTRLRPLRDDPIGWSKDTWKKMGELGWLGIIFPESVGGFGGTFVDAAILLEELGVGLVVEPFVPSLVLAGPRSCGRAAKSSRSAGSPPSLRATRPSRSRMQSRRTASPR